MSTGDLPRSTREFENRHTALAAFLAAAADTPRLLPADAGAGCTLFHALAALQWTGETGLVQPEDRLHAVWFAGETAATVVERQVDEGPVFRFFGPRIEARQRTPAEGRQVIDEMYVQGWEFDERWSALAHFLVVTQGESVLAALMTREAPVVEHVHRWLLELFQGPLPAGADHLHAAWFSAEGAGFLFPPAAFPQERRGYTMVEVGTREG